MLWKVAAHKAVVLWTSVLFLRKPVVAFAFLPVVNKGPWRPKPFLRQLHIPSTPHFINSNDFIIISSSSSTNLDLRYKNIDSTHVMLSSLASVLVPLLSLPPIGSPNVWRHDLLSVCVLENM